MRILYLHQYFVRRDEPGGTRSFEMARRLVERGHSVDLVTTSWRDVSKREPGWSLSEESGIRVHRTTVPYGNEMGFAERIRAFWTFARRALQRAKTIDCDVVFATSTPLTIAWPAVRASSHHQVPMVFEVRDMWPDIPIAIGVLRNPVAISMARRLERYAYDHADAVVVLSPDMRLALSGKVSPERIHVIPNGADIDLFAVDERLGQRFRRSQPWLGDRPLVVYAGTIGDVNGVDYLVRVAKEAAVRNPDIRFLVAGRGRQWSAVHSLARKEGLLDRSFFMIPPIPKNDMPGLLSAADIAVSLFIDNQALWSNSANKFFDALASGTPVAVNYGGWQADLLAQANAGLRLPADDAVAAAEMLCTSLADRRWLETAARAARRMAEERFSRDLLAERLTQVLEATLA